MKYAVSKYYIIFIYETHRIEVTHLCENCVRDNSVCNTNTYVTLFSYVCFSINTNFQTTNEYFSEHQFNIAITSW